MEADEHAGLAAGDGNENRSRPQEPQSTEQGGQTAETSEWDEFLGIADRAAEEARQAEMDGWDEREGATYAGQESSVFSGAGLTGTSSGGLDSFIQRVALQRHRDRGRGRGTRREAASSSSSSSAATGGQDPASSGTVHIFEAVVDTQETGQKPQQKTRVARRMFTAVDRQRGLTCRKVCLLGWLCHLRLLDDLVEDPFVQAAVLSLLCWSNSLPSVPVGIQQRRKKRREDEEDGQKEGPNPSRMEEEEGREEEEEGPSAMDFFEEEFGSFSVSAMNEDSAGPVSSSVSPLKGDGEAEEEERELEDTQKQTATATAPPVSASPGRKRKREEDLNGNGKGGAVLYETLHVRHRAFHIFCHFTRTFKVDQAPRLWWLKDDQKEVDSGEFWSGQAGGGWEELGGWFRGRLQRRLIRAASRRRGSRNIAHLVFTALCRAEGVQARLILAIPSHAFSLSGVAEREKGDRLVLPSLYDLLGIRPVRVAGGEGGGKTVEETGGVDLRGRAQARDYAERAPAVLWVEVFDDTLERWVAVDVGARKFDVADEVSGRKETTRAPRLPCLQTEIGRALESLKLEEGGEGGEEGGKKGERKTEKGEQRDSSSSSSSSSAGVHLPSPPSAEQLEQEKKVRKEEEDAQALARLREAFGSVSFLEREKGQGQKRKRTKTLAEKEPLSLQSSDLLTVRAAIRSSSSSVASQNEGRRWASPVSQPLIKAIREARQESRRLQAAFAGARSSHSRQMRGAPQAPPRQAGGVSEDRDARGSQSASTSASMSGSASSSSFAAPRLSAAPDPTASTTTSRAGAPKKGLVEDDPIELITSSESEAVEEDEERKGGSFPEAEGRKQTSRPRGSAHLQTETETGVSKGQQKASDEDRQPAAAAAASASAVSSSFLLFGSGSGGSWGRETGPLDTGRVGAPLCVSRLWEGAPLVFAVAAGPRHAFVDVTRRYTQTWSRVLDIRGQDLQGWWKDTLNLLHGRQRGQQTAVIAQKGEQERVEGEAARSQTAPSEVPLHVGGEQREGGGGNIGSAVADDAKEKEATLKEKMEAADEAEQTRIAAKEPLPKRKNAFRGHPQYALESQLSRYEAIWPKDPKSRVALFEGEAVWPRSLVKQLHSAERWSAEMRKVRDREVTQPFRLISIKKPPPMQQHRGRYAQGTGQLGGAASAAGGRSAGGGDATVKMVALYGEWQTEALEIPEAKDGTIPVNERGNVDLIGKPPPKGTVHLKCEGNSLLRVTKKLGVPSAPALVGFDYKRGRATPRFGGVVVLSADAEKVQKAHKEDEERRARNALLREREEAAKLWRGLMKQLLLQRYLKTLEEQREAERERKRKREEGGAGGRRRALLASQTSSARSQSGPGGMFSKFSLDELKIRIERGRGEGGEEHEGASSATAAASASSSSALTRIGGMGVASLHLDAQREGDNAGETEQEDEEERRKRLEKLGIEEI